jgi:UTP--glucose-1-phosphate uridylyltransferase
MKRVRKAVLPVAGFGTRMLPATKAQPKEMLPVFDRPAVHWVVEEAVEAGIEHFVFITGRNKNSIEDYFDRAYELEDSLRSAGKTVQLRMLEDMLPLAGTKSFVRQQSALGLGHAIWCARDVVGNEPFAVLLPDVLIQSSPSCLKQLVDAYEKVRGNVIAVDTIPFDEVSKYGVIARGTTIGTCTTVVGMVEKPSREVAPSNLRITGRYILQPEIFELLGTQLGGAGGEIQLTDAMLRLMATQDFHAVEFMGKVFDCGSPVGYAEAFVSYALRNKDVESDIRRVIGELLQI